MKVRIETEHYFSTNHEHKRRYKVIHEDEEFEFYTRPDVDNYISYLEAIRNGNPKVEEIEI